MVYIHNAHQESVVWFNVPDKATFSQFLSDFKIGFSGITHYSGNDKTWRIKHRGVPTTISAIYQTLEDICLKHDLLMQNASEQEFKQRQQSAVSVQQSGVYVERDSPHFILQILPTAEPEVVSAAWKALIRKYHPDKEQDALRKKEAERKSADINAAFQRISGGSP